MEGSGTGANVQPGRIRVGILDDQRVFRDCLVMLFEQSGMEVVACSSDVQGFRAQVEQVAPDVAIIDIQLDSSDSQEGAAGLDVVEWLWSKHPATASLILSACWDRPLVERCFHAGAAGYLCKLNVSRAELLSAVERVARGERLIPQKLRARLLEEADDEGAGHSAG